MSPRATFQVDELTDLKPTPVTSKVEATAPTSTIPEVDDDEVDDPARLYAHVTKEKNMTKEDNPEAGLLTMEQVLEPEPLTVECYDGGYTFLITKSEADELEGKFDMASDAAAGEE